jgi:hypothetical protein
MASAASGSGSAQGLYNQAFGSASRRFRGEDGDGSIGGAPISNTAAQAFSDAQNKDYMKAVGPALGGFADVQTARMQAEAAKQDTMWRTFAQLNAPRQSSGDGGGILGAAIGAAGSILGGPIGGVAAKGLSKVFNFG